MKASELIEELKKSIEAVGDVDVVVMDYEHGDTDHITNLYHRKGEIVIG